MTELGTTPPPSRLLAVIDETTPFLGAGVGYVIVACILLGDPAAAAEVMRSVIADGRRRPFHWHTEGVMAKEAALKALLDLDVMARAIAVPCARGRQEAARAVALGAMVEQLVDDGCGRLLIEARTPAQDGRDQGTILNVVRPRKAALEVSWERKANELLWIADAVGGVVHAHLTGHDTEDRFELLAGSTGLELQYRALPPPAARKKR